MASRRSMDESPTTNSHSSKKPKHLNVCHSSINDLPDCLLRHMISFLQIDDAFRTSFVSRRWRSLWDSLPCLDFRETRLNTKIEIVPFIDKLLSLHNGVAIRRFHASLYYQESHASSVDSWIQFALERRAEEIDLHLSDIWYPLENPHVAVGQMLIEVSHKLPSSLFNSQYLRVLALRQCDLNLHGPVSLSSLKTLILDMVEIDDVMIKTLISGSPLLENLEILCCNYRSDLNIFDANGQLRCLKIVCFSLFVGDPERIDIYAPNLLSLDFSGYMPDEGFRIKSLSSSAGVSFDFEKMLYSGDGGSNHQTELLELLDDVRHAKVIKLTGWCIQVLAYWERKNLRMPSFNTPHLELRTSLKKWELPWIIYVLRVFFSIESLTIVIDPMQESGIYFNMHDPYQRVHWQSEELPFCGQFLHLKTICIHGFMSSKSSSLEEHGSEEADGIIEHCANEIKLVKLLLQNTEALEVMTISTPKTECSSRSLVKSELHSRRLFVKSELLHNLSTKLLAIPRTSPRAKIFFS